MTQLLWRKNRGMKGKLLISGILLLSLGLPEIALARYNPSRRVSTPGGRHRTTTVSRGLGGCNDSAKASLTALAPVSHVGQTTSTHPTFAWFAPDTTPYPVEFVLSEVDPSGQDRPIQTIQIPEAQYRRVMSLTLPADQPGLTTGKTYHWKVVVMCNSNRPAKSPLAEALMEVVEAPASLKTALAETRDRTQRVDLYAEAGLWYDALAEAMAEGGAQGNTLTPLERTILEQLVQVESGTQSDAAIAQVEHLKQVIASDRGQ